MMTLLALALALATPDDVPQTGKRRVLVLDMKAQAVDAPTTQTISDVVAHAFARDPNLIVTSGADVRAMLDVEASKQSFEADCAAKESCLAEIAGALGADLVVSGSVGRLGELLIVTISVYDATQQASIAKAKVEDTDIAKISPKIDAAVLEMRGIANTGARSGSPLLLPGIVTAVAGSLVAVAGGVIAGYGYAVQVDPTSSGGQKDGASIAYPVGLTTLGVGGLVAIVGGALVVFSLSE
jgi:TolB-like protein